MTGPIGHFFYHGMDKVVTRYFKIGTLGFVLAKVLGDELLFGPVHVGGYFAWMTLAEGGSIQVCHSQAVAHPVRHAGLLAWCCNGSCMQSMSLTLGVQSAYVVLCLKRFVSLHMQCRLLGQNKFDANTMHTCMQMHLSSCHIRHKSLARLTSW